MFITKKEMKAVHQKTYRQNHREELRRQNKTYSQTEAGKKSHVASQVKQRRIHPERVRARYTLCNAVKSGKVERPAYCESCYLPAETQGHHPDYAEPFEVIWLCQECHTAIHQNVIGAL